MNGFSEPRILYLKQKQSRTTKKKGLKSCHSKLISCPNQCVYNLPSSVNLVQLSPIFEHVTLNAPTLRADRAYYGTWLECIMLPLCASVPFPVKWIMQGACEDQVQERKVTDKKAGSWTDVSSVLSLHDVDSEFSLVRSFWSY